MLERLRSMPLKGDSKLLKRCESAGAIGHGAPVIAVFDDDRVRRLLSLPAPTPKRTAAREILKLSGSPSCLVAWLLVKNTESLVHSLADFYAVATPPKRPIERDRILNRAAEGSQRTARQHVRDAVQTFDCLVRGVARLCACP